jgi:hypothetical protein
MERGYRHGVVHEDTAGVGNEWIFRVSLKNKRVSLKNKISPRKCLRTEHWALAEENASWSSPFGASLQDPLLQFLAGDFVDPSVHRYLERGVERWDG